jgi:hypothetical protein
MQGLDPAVIVHVGGPGGDDVLAVFPKFQMQANGIGGATPEAIVPLLIEIWIDELFHNELISRDS